MMSLARSLLTLSMLTATLCGAFQPEEWAVIRTDREDGRHVSSRGVAQAMLESVEPACAFRADMPPEEMKAWQERVRQAMQQLMHFPQAGERPAPKLVRTAQREGYRIERWESYPFDKAATPYLLLIPDGVSESAPAPAVFCIPGSGQTKEQLAGESSSTLAAPPAQNPGNNAMALHYVREGWVAVVVDNAGTGETGDAERAAGRGGFDDDNLARFMLEMGWSWLGYTAYTDQCILDWLKNHPCVRRDRIVISGFSLGTEPLMVLGVLNPDIYAFVYNDFLCRTLERLQVLTKPNQHGARPAPNSIRHLIPGFLLQFDFPDLVAALAPRPVICTEGGLDRDFLMVQKAYTLAGAQDNFSYFHQPKFANAERWQGDHLPHGLDRNEFFNLANVDPRNHFFKKDLVIPWLHRLLNTRNDHADAPAH